MLMVFKLHRDFDIAEALKHGTADARLSTNFTGIGLPATAKTSSRFPSSDDSGQL